MAEIEISCDLIADLLPAYLEGEASPATRNLVESHLDRCEGCRSLVEEARQGERLLAGGVPSEEAAAEIAVDRAVVRFRRGLLVVAALLFGGVALLLAETMRIIFLSILDAPLPRPDAADLGVAWWVVAAAGSVALVVALRRGGSAGRLVALVLTLPLALLLYVLMSDGTLLGSLIFGGLLVWLHLVALQWRGSCPAGSPSSEFLRSLLAALPLSVLALGTVNALMMGSLPGALLSLAMLLGALALTWIRIDSLPRAAGIVALIFVLATGLVLVRGIVGASQLVAVDTPVAPPASMQEAADLDLGTLELEPLESGGTDVLTLDSLPAGAEASSYRSTGDLNGGMVMVHFTDAETAERYLDDWTAALGAETWTTQAPDRGEGRRSVVRGYDGTSEVAYAAWQQEEWALFVQSEGRLTRSLPHALAILEGVAEQWKE
jgi:hypothetical protein